MKALIHGGTGMLGAALARTKPAQVEEAIYVSDAGYRGENYDIEIHAAARVGGVSMNAEQNVMQFIVNLGLATQTTHCISKSPNRRHVVILSSCCYSPNVISPYLESDFHVCPPDPGNSGYAYAKRAMDSGARVASQINPDTPITSLVLTNLYGPSDRGFREPHSGHAIPAMICKIDKGLPLYGNGTQYRQFTYVDDAASLIWSAALNHQSGYRIVNAGFPREYKLADVADMICVLLGKRHPGWTGDYPGVHRKPMRCTMEATTDLSAGLAKTVEWYCAYRVDNGD